MPSSSRRALLSTLALLSAWALPRPLQAAVDLPVRIFTADARPVLRTVSLFVPPGAAAAEALYLQVHNVKRGGQVSVAVNGGAWTDLYNHTVALLPSDARAGGIGGIHPVLRLHVPLEPALVVAGQANDVHLRLNGTDGLGSGFRVLALNFLSGEDQNLVPPSEFTHDDPAGWTSPLPDPVDIAAGQALFSGEGPGLIEDPVSGEPLRSACNSCHFADGSDLHYFRYSNESIVSRSMFHGLSQTEGEQIASYIRSLPGPSPGNPWDPPFQPGPGLDAGPADAWMAGAGIGAVLDDEAEMISALFPDGTSPGAVAEVFEHSDMLNLRELAIPMQLPDWNAWLPHYAPEDLWDPEEPLYGDAPWTIYSDVRGQLLATGVTALAADGELWETWNRFRRYSSEWIGGLRLEDKDLANESAVSLAREPRFSREEMIFSFSRWIAVHSMQLVREFDLEAAKDDLDVMRVDSPHFYHEPRNFDARKSVTFGLGPHITSNNWKHFAWQPLHIGKFNTHQWYWLATVTNGSSKQKAPMNAPWDWDYHLSHTNQSYVYGNAQSSVRSLAVLLKNLQGRDSGVGIKKQGFSQRTLFPNELFSGNTGGTTRTWQILDSMETRLWAKVFEAYLYEWLDVVEGYDLSDSDLVPREPTPGVGKHQLEAPDVVALDYPGSGNFFGGVQKEFIHSAWRLIPLLDHHQPTALGAIDELLLEDFKRWCERAWPGPAGSQNDWDSRLTRTSLWAANFEDATSPLAGASVQAIKSAAWVNNGSIAPRNGGGAYVGRLDDVGAGETRQVEAVGVSAALAPETAKLELRGRFAVEEAQAGALRVAIAVRFAGSATWTDGPALELNDALHGRKFESYQSTIGLPPGAATLDGVRVSVVRDGAGVPASHVYLDNLYIREVGHPDIIAPAPPVLDGVRNHYLVRWSHPDPVGDGVVGYKLYRWIDEDPASRVLLNRDYLVYNLDDEYTDLTAAAGVDYWFEVTAVDAAGNESAPSNAIFESGDESQDDEAPAVVHNVFLLEPGPVPKLGFFASTAWDVAGYHVYRRTVGDSVGFVRLTPEPIGALFYEDSGAVPGRAYEYVVRAVDLVGNESADSLSIGVGSHAVPALPTPGLIALALLLAGVGIRVTLFGQDRRQVRLGRCSESAGQ